MNTKIKVICFMFGNITKAKQLRISVEMKKEVDLTV